METTMADFDFLADTDLPLQQDIELLAQLLANTIREQAGNATAEPGLWLAGDYTAGHGRDYPATLEGAVRSGVAAADGVLKSCY